MAIIDELRILVTAEVTKAIADLNKTEQATNKAGAGFKDFAKQVAGYTTGMGLAVDATKKVLSTIGQLAKESVVLAAGFETSRTSWGVLLGDMEEGEQMFDRIFALAAKTPLSFEAVEQGARTLGQYGIQSEKIIPTIKMLGDISMGNGEKLRSLSIAYGQVMSTGRLMGQDLLQLINNGFNPLKVISEKTGESMADLKKRMADGGVSAEEVAGAFKAATSEGGLFYNMMDKTAETTAGKWSTAQDNFKAGLAELGNTVVPAVNLALDGFNVIMEKIASNASKKALGNIISESLKTGMISIGEVKATLDSAGMSYDDFIEQVTAARDAVSHQIIYGAKGKELEKLQQESAILTGIILKIKDRAGYEKRLAEQAEKDKKALQKTAESEQKLKQAQDDLNMDTWLQMNYRGFMMLGKEAPKTFDEMNAAATAFANSLSLVQNVGLTPWDESQYWDSLGKSVNDYIDAVERLASEKGLSFADAAKEYNDAIDKSKGKTQEQILLEQQLKNVALDAYKSLGNALGEALINGEEGWEAFADAGKAAIASVLEAFAAQWAIEAVAAYAAGNIPSGVGYTAASVAGYAGAGAIRAMANGGEFDTTGPTMMMVGEAGREHVSVSPASRGGSGGATVINYNIAGSLVSERQLNQRIRSASTGSNR